MNDRTSRRGRRAVGPMLVAALFGLTITLPVLAQQAAPFRLRGTVTRIAGDEVTVKAIDGRTLRINLTKDATVAVVVPARLKDLKPGRFIGTAARPAGEKWRALEVHLFPPGSRLGEGHRPWAPEPGATMTNGDLTAAVLNARSGELTVSTGGQAYVVEIPPGTPVVAMNAGTRASVVSGSRVVFNQVLTEPNGSYSAKSVTVSKDRRYPPK